MNSLATACPSLESKMLAPNAYPHTVEGIVELVETHQSWVFLAGSFAYKIKKPICDQIHDYSTLAKRHHACCEELRLGMRYSDNLYVDVVAITEDNEGFMVDGDAEPIEFAVRMRRFSSDAQLSHRLDAGHQVSSAEMIALAETIANFHDNAETRAVSEGCTNASVAHQALQNLDMLSMAEDLRPHLALQHLRQWTIKAFSDLEDIFSRRHHDGWIRECHGDLHCDNIVHWNGHWIPFDGIEFNSELSWIDVLNDLSFLLMDLFSRGLEGHASILLNAYLEKTGDYRGLPLLRWYMVYRALVKAKVAMLRADQLTTHPSERADSIFHARNYIALATSMTRQQPKQLWITFGESGSGKSTASLAVVASQNMIRLRSDTERKRMYARSPINSLEQGVARGIYSSKATEAIYHTLWMLARELLDAGISVIVDATFLLRADRNMFLKLANLTGAEFKILHFGLDADTLRQRVISRNQQNSEDSRLSMEVLERQIRIREKITPAEQLVALDGTKFPALEF